MLFAWFVVKVYTRCHEHVRSCDYRCRKTACLRMQENPHNSRFLCVATLQIVSPLYVPHTHVYHALDCGLSPCMYGYFITYFRHKLSQCKNYTDYPTHAQTVDTRLCICNRPGYEARQLHLFLLIYHPYPPKI